MIFCILFRLAEMEGFEPPMTLMPDRFSRPARSTAPAHLLFLLLAFLSSIRTRLEERIWEETRIPNPEQIGKEVLMRRVPESNRRIDVLQTPAFPLRQRAIEMYFNRKPQRVAIKLKLNFYPYLF